MKKNLFLLGFLFVFALPAISQNLLKNPDAEEKMAYWVDPDSAWFANGDECGPQNGQLFFWPSRRDLPVTSMYQDVSLASYKAGTILTLTAWLCNYNQSPHDQATLSLLFLNSAGQVIGTYTREQRNPKWTQHSIDAAIPAGAAKARVMLTATRFVGQDNDAYFDNLSLVASTNKVLNEVVISEKSRRYTKGDKIQLYANNGINKSATSFEWSSSYDLVATVDQNGLVSFLGTEDDEVTIYAKDKASGVIGAYKLNAK